MCEEMTSYPAFSESVKWCDTREVKIPNKYGNDTEGRCLIHVPKNLKGTKGNVAFIEFKE